MEKFLNSKKKLAILSTGGVLRNKKLQKGSTLSFLANAPAIPKEVDNFSNIHLFQFFLKEQEMENPLFSYKSRRSSPFMIDNEPAQAPAPKSSGGSMKPPLLKLNLSPFSQATYADL